ncbi:uncharacterized protein BO96DRAFT_426646 [Aspergillus niger CBS 101883]|uniref:uncharacterized protein n=1 Tax=Aspergillus lacticoffeatus (strain CBS 101883) TaxID=1450533 RepID=UPI000D7F16FB|nr:uncharacterized protein BO96DRAFT_426646 [Aspergillus niger CBS 101883]PYH52291.1 hypothetical protein BO96DRAFT_426646 [Aspergillus niger CBS 101883]
MFSVLFTGGGSGTVVTTVRRSTVVIVALPVGCLVTPRNKGTKRKTKLWLDVWFTKKWWTAIMSIHLISMKISPASVPSVYDGSFINNETLSYHQAELVPGAGVTASTNIFSYLPPAKSGIKEILPTPRALVYHQFRMALGVGKTAKEKSIWAPRSSSSTKAKRQRLMSSVIQSVDDFDYQIFQPSLTFMSTTNLLNLHFQTQHALLVRADACRIEI